MSIGGRKRSRKGARGMVLSDIKRWFGVWALVSLLALDVVGKAAESPTPVRSGGSSAFQLPPLPYAEDALEPYVSSRTMGFHHGKHHQAYVDNLNKLTTGTPWAGQPLEKVIQEAAGVADKAAVFNNAAQVWNHTFYWNCLAPKAGSLPSGALAAAIDKNFGSFAQFREKFTNAAVTLFGSGWAWLVQNADGSLAVEQAGNAGNPLKDGKRPLLTCDVWEHAYYIDYRNARAKYVEAYWNLVNWQFVAGNLK